MRWTLLREGKMKERKINNEAETDSEIMTERETVNEEDKEKRNVGAQTGIGVTCK